MFATCSTHLSSRSSAFAGPRVLPSSFKPFVPCVARAPLSIDAAHKQGAGSTKNGRDSQPKRRGVKVFGGQPVKAGGIIFRQVGSQWYPGENVGMGKDYTIYSKISGIVIYEQDRRGTREISVFPLEHETAIAEVKKTHTIAPKEGVPTRKERRRAMYTPRAQQRALAAGTTVSVAAVVAAVSP